ncbi:DUF983 domain-containing protein [Flagellimonas aquimarina]|uniref:DUF983 domain-containing protein n=1 Tax=Flagellimonas aquimarina TaxID=2201895 RepID=A0A316KXF4_9FLAO|nr:DUF983 domain-containing protein [Allomuricauda koreensis]PWL38907.1 DUF983 domain-containing protein [Allomuricauda koreensis]
MKFLKGTKLYSILTGTCPVCQNEIMYTEQNPYKLSSTLKMQERCGHCNTKYKIEPSFFYGAMYVSYPVGLAFASFAFVMSYLVFNLSLIMTYGLIVVIMFMALPLILRISRNIWINFFMTFEKLKSEPKA